METGIAAKEIDEGTKIKQRAEPCLPSAGREGGSILLLRGCSLIAANSPAGENSIDFQTSSALNLVEAGLGGKGKFFLRANTRAAIRTCPARTGSCTQMDA